MKVILSDVAYIVKPKQSRFNLTSIEGFASELSAVQAPVTTQKKDEIQLPHFTWFTYVCTEHVQHMSNIKFVAFH